MENPKPHFDLSDFLTIIARRKWFFIVPLVVIYISFLVSSYFLPRVYEARAIVLIEEKKLVNPLLENLAVSTSIAERLGTLTEEIFSWPRLFQLVEKLGLNKNITSPLDLERLIQGIRTNLKLEIRSKSSDIIAISYHSKDPKNAQKIVNTFCDILIKTDISSQREDTESAIDFINDQLAIYKEKLDKSEAELREFREVYGMYISEGSDSKVPLGQINEELGELEAELVMASVDCTDEHPRIKDLKRRVEAIKERRNQYIEEIAQRTGLDAQSYVNIADSFPRQQEELARLTRDKSINERIYAMLLERLETARITERLDSSENRTQFIIVEPARLPLLPTQPNRLKFSFLGLLLGGVVGIGLVYLLEYTDSSFKSQDGLKDFFGYPVLGSISKIVTVEDLIKRKEFNKRMMLGIGAGVVLFSLVLIIIT